MAILARHVLASRGGYVMFPRDAQAVAMIQDDRWTIPPSPVDWAIEKWLLLVLPVPASRWPQ
jgi:hypothetical protein